MAQTATSTSKLAREFEVIAVCYHESGHVLFGLLRCLKITSVMVSYSQAVEGITHYLGIERPDLTPDIIDTLARDEVRMSYAGLVAEQLYYRDICGSAKFPSILKEGWSNDIKAASDVIKTHNLALPGKQRVALKRQVQKELHAMMIEHWSDLKLISHALYKTKRLSLEDLKLLLTKKSNKRQYWKERFKTIEMLFDQSKTIDNTEIRIILA
jgi:hypothetical protein